MYLSAGISQKWTFPSLIRNSLIEAHYSPFRGLVSGSTRGIARCDAHATQPSGSIKRRNASDQANKATRLKGRPSHFIGQPKPFLPRQPSSREKRLSPRPTTPSFEGISPASRCFPSAAIIRHQPVSRSALDSSLKAPASCSIIPPPGRQKGPRKTRSETREARQLSCFGKQEKPNTQARNSSDPPNPPPYFSLSLGRHHHVW